MRPCFKRSGEIATSSSVETEFSDIKSRGFKGQLLMRGDKFVVQHLDFLDAKITLASDNRDIITTNNISLISSEENIIHDYNDSKENNSSNLSTYTVCINEEQRSEDNKKNESFQNFSDITNNIKNISDVSETIKSTDIEYASDNTNSSGVNPKSDNLNKENEVWNICENWHGLTGSTNITDECSQALQKPAPIKRSKPTYLDKCSEWDFIKNSKSFNLPLVINGSKCRPIKQGQLIITVQETCAFDSILQLVVSATVAHAAYQTALQSSSNDIFRLAKSILEHGKLLSKHYNERASILQNLPLFHDTITTYTRNIKRLNCNVAHLAEHLFKNEPSCIYNKSCSCGAINSRQTITCNVNVDILL